MEAALGNLSERHEELRGEVKHLRISVEAVDREMWRLKVKIAGYAAFAGSLTTVVGKLIEHYMR